MLVIGNGRMITQDASTPFLENGAVAMDGNTIVMVGVTEEVKKVYHTEPCSSVRLCG